MSITDAPGRLWARIDRRTEGECWPWQGAASKNSGGNLYGNMRVGGETKLVHRFMWEVHHGAVVPDGMVVRHKCDNPICCNPAHLEIGTQKQNIRDCFDRGRARRAQGQAHGNANMDEVTVRRIRTLVRDGASVSDAAKTVGVSYACIRSALDHWKHVK